MINKETLLNQSSCIMYHYVRDNLIEETPNLNSLNIEKFKDQLDFFQQNLEIISYDEFKYFINFKKEFPKGKYLLSFDDGLKDHYKNVYPILKERGLWGLFFINSSVYTEKKPLDVHLVHLLISKLGVNEIYDQVKYFIKKNKITLIDFDNEGLYRYDNDINKELKSLLNYKIDYNTREQLIKNLYTMNFNNYKNFCDEFYCSILEIKEMIKNSMIFGSHSHSHKVLSRLSKANQEIEIEKSSRFLKKVFSIENSAFCFPYGGANSFNNISCDLLEKYSHSSAFTTLRGPLDIADGRFSLKRYDTVDLKLE